MQSPMTQATEGPSTILKFPTVGVVLPKTEVGITLLFASHKQSYRPKNHSQSMSNYQCQTC